MNTIWIVMPILIVLMFQLGIEIDRQAFVEVARKPQAVIAGLIGQLIALPLIALALGLFFNLPPIYFMGLVLIACCPGGSSSNVFSMLAKGDVALSITLTALSSVITLFTIPLVMEAAATVASAQMGVEIELPIGKLLVQNIVLMFLPMALGALFRKLWPKAAGKVQMVLKKFAFPALIILISVFFAQHFDTIIANIGRLGLIVAALILLAMGTGLLLVWLFKLREAARRTIIIEVGMQNAAQAITVATSPLIFNSVEMAIPAIIYSLLMNVILLGYLKIFCRD